MKIGVFDSGIGGQSVANAIMNALPDAEVVFRHDSAEHFPYANKTPEELLGFVVPVLESLVQDGCKLIVVACNTVSTTLITELRSRFTVPLVAIEPMVKPASEITKSKVIAVCATPTTLASKRYAELKETYARKITVLEPDCSDWSVLIERNEMSEERIGACIAPVLAQEADVIVLGCTHYHWIDEDIQKICAGRAVVLQPETAIVERLKTVLARLG